MENGLAPSGSGGGVPFVRRGIVTVPCGVVNVSVSRPEGTVTTLVAVEVVAAGVVAEPSTVDNDDGNADDVVPPDAVATGTCFAAPLVEQPASNATVRAPAVPRTKDDQILPSDICTIISKYSYGEIVV